MSPSLQLCPSTPYPELAQTDALKAKPESFSSGSFLRSISSSCMDRLQIYSDEPSKLNSAVDTPFLVLGVLALGRGEIDW